MSSRKSLKRVFCYLMWFILPRITYSQVPKDPAVNDFHPPEASLNIGQSLKVLSWQRSGPALTVTTSGGILKLTPYLYGVLQVQFGSAGNIKAVKSFAVSRKPEAIAFKVKSNKDDLILSTAAYTVYVSRYTSQVKITDHSGKPLIRELLNGGHNAVSGDSLLVADTFQLTNEEALYGLGQFRDGVMNLRGKRRELVQMNTQAAVPVILSTNGWGLFWDNPSRTIFKDDDKGMAFASDYGKAISYYIFTGTKLDDLIAGYRKLTGTAPMPARWSLGYHQSRNRYASQQEVLEVAGRMREDSIPFSSIFIDYHYWGKYGTGSHHFDEQQFPDFAGMVAKLHHQLHTKLIVTVWPSFSPGSANYDDMKRNGFLLEGVKALDGTVYDAFNPKAAASYWHKVATQLVPKGIDGWFLDGPEPDNVNTFFKANTFAGPALTVRNLFPLVHTTNFYNGLLTIAPNTRPYIITRCAWASQQKNGTVIWSGDIGSTFAELKKQITAGLNFTASGIPYWTTDIGGYSGGNPQDPAYREVFTRWWQYGAFCPVFRSHGRRYPGDTKAPNELWAYGPATQKICTDYDNFRYRLLPYIYSLSAQVTQKNYTPMRLLAFDFAGDKQVLNIKDEFMYGPALLVNPVTDSGAIKRKVYLPAGTKWVDFWTGQTYIGGKTIIADAPIAQLPLFVKSGSIIPLGQVQQYTDEKKNAPIELRIYPGADGSFELYEDDGVSYDYKKGAFSKIHFSWNDHTNTLTISVRSGNFKGLLKNRTFHIIRVSSANARGFTVNGAYLSISYSGKAKRVHVPL